MNIRTLLQSSFTLFTILLLSASAFAQGGSGNLPPVPKTATKAKVKVAPKPKTPTTTNTPKPTTKNIVAKDPIKVGVIEFDEVIEGKLEEVAAGRTATGIYYQDYTFTATDEDLIKFQFKSANASLGLTLLDEKKAEVALKRDEASGDLLLNNEDQTLEESGTYRLRISIPPNTSLGAPITYSLRLVHIGLTDEGYQTRLQQIIAAFNLPGERKIDETIAQLEKLAKDDVRKPGAFEYLGMLYTEHKQDTTKAYLAMARAIELGGAATFKITHDSKWRKATQNKRLKQMVWPDQRTNWLKISNQQLALADFATPDKTSIVLNQSQLSECNQFGDTPFVIIKHNIKTIKANPLGVAFSSAAEAAMAVDLIKKNLFRKD